MCTCIQPDSWYPNSRTYVPIRFGEPMNSKSILDVFGMWIDGDAGPKQHRFQFDAGSGFTGYQVEQALRQYGVRITGRKARGNKRSFLVESSQAVWAEYLLCRMGVPLENALLDPRNRQYAVYHGNTMPTPWDAEGLKPEGFIERLGEFLARYFA
jgi:transposase InsO family protein